MENNKKSNGQAEVLDYSKIAAEAKRRGVSLEQIVTELVTNQLTGGDENAHKIVTEVEYSSTIKKVIIPEGMSKLQAAQDLTNQYNNEEQKQDFLTILDGWEWKDSLRAFRNVLEEKFGWIKGVTTFWSTPIEIDIVTSIVNGLPQTEKAFYGKVAFPAYEDAQGSVGIGPDGVVSIRINAKRKFGEQISMFFKEVRQYLHNNSIYRGKPVVVSQKIQDHIVIIDLEITELKPDDKIILNEKERLAIDNFIINALEDGGKHSFLFVGSYGNGKTETALSIGANGVSRGMSFFYVKDSSMFEKVLAFAKNYEPCIIFLEDVDEIAGGAERTERMNKILNTLDGVQTKGRNINVIFTTNHHDRINPALRRPGRIDLIVDFQNPAPETQEKILLALFKNIMGVDDLDMPRIVKQLPNAQGAVIAEIGKRAIKLSSRTNIITTEMVIAAVASMEYQIKFMNEDVSGGNKLVGAFDTVRKYLNDGMEFPQMANQEED